MDGDGVSVVLVQWHWKVFLNIEYYSYLDIPNLQNVNLFRKFWYVRSKSISSIVWLIWFHSQMFLPFLLILSKSRSNCSIGSIHFIPLRSMIIGYSMFTLFVCSANLSYIIVSGFIIDQSSFDSFPSLSLQLV